MYRLLLSLLALGGCYLSTYPLSPVKVAPSIYLVRNAQFQGTAWVVNPHYLVTAGHMCGLDGDYTIARENGITLPVTRVIWSVSRDATGDACVLHSATELPRPLILAKDAPAKGTSDYYIGYPLGSLLTSGGAVEADGGSSAWCAPGASGSPSFTPQGVYGIVVQGRPNPEAPNGYGYDAGCQDTPVGYIKALLTAVGVSYLETPELIQESEDPSASSE